MPLKIQEGSFMRSIKRKSGLFLLLAAGSTGLFFWIVHRSGNIELPGTRGGISENAHVPVSF